MTAVNVAPYILARYPETSPYDLDPVPYNVVPGPNYLRFTIEFRDAMREWQNTTGKNPLRILNSHNPYVLPDPAFHDVILPLSRPHLCSPQLATVPLHCPLEFLERLDISSSGSTFKARSGDMVYVIKVFSATEVDSFHCERRNAYTHLMACKAHEGGAILRCHGWVQLSQQALSSWEALPPSETGTSSNNNATPLMGLLFDFVPGMVQITTENMTRILAESALRALIAIHKAEVLVGKVEEHAFMVAPDRAVWFGFEHSRCCGDTSVRRQDFLKELADGWDYLYTYLESERLLWGQWSPPSPTRLLDAREVLG